MRTAMALASTSVLAADSARSCETREPRVCKVRAINETRGHEDDRQDKKDREDKKDIPVHEAMALFETARTDVKVVHKEDDRQRLK